MKSLDETLLEKLAEWRFDNGPQTLAVPHAESGWTAAVQAECADRVGCRVWELKLTRPDVVSDVAGLKARAERVAGRVTGLLEPLRLVELDAGRETALLRSAAPQKRGDDLFYYEVELRAGAAGVRRYQGSAAGAPRKQVGFSLTHEGLAKLAGDLTADA